MFKPTLANIVSLILKNQSVDDILDEYFKVGLAITAVTHRYIMNIRVLITWSL